MKAIKRVLFSLLGSAFLFSCAHVNGASPQPIDSLENVELGGHRQLVLTKADRGDLPLLLYIHGGPGLPCIPYEHEIAELEKDFIVVFWDQRGCGKSEPQEHSGFSAEAYLRDAEELVDILLKRHRQEKLFVVAHSWGSVVGVRLAAAIPEKIRAYVGTGQMVNGMMNEAASLAWATEKAESAGDQEALAVLRGLRPPYIEGGALDVRSLMTQRMTLASLGGMFHDPAVFGNDDIFASMLRSPHYTRDDLAAMQGRTMAATMALWPELVALDLFSEVPRLDVPVFFLMGASDRNTDVDLARRYFDALRAPRGKEFVLFEGSGHFALFEENAKFVAELRRIKSIATR